MAHDWDQHHAAHGHGPDAHGDASAAELAGFLTGMPSLPGRALDIGCGTGADAVFLAQQGIDVVGLDLSATALDQARSRADRAGVQVEWVQADALALPLEDASIDLALDRGHLHHVLPHDQPRYVAEVARVLRPGGSLLVREINVVGHHAHAVDETALRAMLAHEPLTIRTIVRHGRTMLAAVDRVA